MRRRATDPAIASDIRKDTDFFKKERSGAPTHLTFEQRQSMFSSYLKTLSRARLRDRRGEPRTSEYLLELALYRGEFEVIDLVTRGAAVFNDAGEVESARTLSIKIKDDRFDLRFTVVKQPSGKHRHGKWDEDHEQTRVFILDNGDIRKLLEVVFDQERLDFSEQNYRPGAVQKQTTKAEDSSLSM